LVHPQQLGNLPKLQRSIRPQQRHVRDQGAPSRVICQDGDGYDEAIARTERSWDPSLVWPSSPVRGLPMRLRPLPSYTQNKNVVDIPFKQVITLFDANARTNPYRDLANVWNIATLLTNPSAKMSAYESNPATSPIIVR
jgi:hypothetical protein